MSKLITVEQLHKAGIPANTIERFRGLFGNQLKVTWQKCVEYADLFDFRHLGVLILSPPDRNAFIQRNNRYPSIVRDAYSDHMMFVKWILTLNSEQPLALAASAAEHKRIVRQVLKLQRAHDAQLFATLYGYVK